VATNFVADVHISYYDAGNGDLKHALIERPVSPATDPTITTTTVDSGGDVGQFTSIALDSDFIPRISYYDFSNGDLKSADRGDGWLISIVDSGGADDVGQYSSIAIDSDTYPDYSYYDATNQDLKYYQFSDTTVDSGGNVGQFTSIAVGQFGTPYISYYDADGGDLKYAVQIEGWSTNVVDTGGLGDVGQYTSIALEPVTAGIDDAHISYYDVTNGDLKYALLPGGNLPATIATIDNEGNVGQYSAIALAGSTVHISYYDAGNSDLKYATNGSGAWVVTTLDSPGDVGLFTSIAVSNGSPHISYYDRSSGVLKYATPTMTVIIPEP
jgi:hypothetical protein